jgi:hypothetical protein
VIQHVLATGVKTCFDEQGREIECSGSGQDAELGLGRRSKGDRFARLSGETVQDTLTGLVWVRDLSMMPFPMRWSEALDHVRGLNRERFSGFDDWRMPNRRELRSLINHGRRRPALDEDHPFQGLQQTWFWTSTTSAMYPAYAWYVHLAGGRMFWGRKDQFYMLWPVRGQSPHLPWTGENQCRDDRGSPISCPGTGQDGEHQQGAEWPVPRFEPLAAGVLDRLTNLVWMTGGQAPQGTMTWAAALDRVHDLARSTGLPWHLPNINEMESLVDASRHTPALPAEAGFSDVQEVYWSSTSSGFEPDWAYALYMHKGAVGVGHKPTAEFALWPVMEYQVR